MLIEAQWARKHAAPYSEEEQVTPQLVRLPDWASLKILYDNQDLVLKQVTGIKSNKFPQCVSADMSPIFLPLSTLILSRYSLDISL